MLSGRSVLADHAASIIRVKEQAQQAAKKGATNIRRVSQPIKFTNVNHIVGFMWGTLEAFVHRVCI
jgi:hypothetical protein